MFITFYCGSQFTYEFWKSFQNGLSTCVNHSTTFQPQTIENVEHTIQTLEDMLRACVIYFEGNWNDHILLIDLSYSYSYHSNIDMTPFEALYGRRFRSPIF